MPIQNSQLLESLSQKSFIEFCDHLSEIIVKTTKDDLILFTNKAFEKHFGFSDDQIKNKNIDTLFLNNKIDLSHDKKANAIMVDKNGDEFKCELKFATYSNGDNSDEYNIYFIGDLRKSIEQ